jgi:hypothetical protein
VTEQGKRRGEEVGFRGREGKSGKRVGRLGVSKGGLSISNAKRERESSERELMRRERGERQLNEEREKRVRWIFCGRGLWALVWHIQIFFFVIK